jgi:ActR/RegA family two-component response regulator
VLIDMKIPDGEGSSVFQVVRDANPQARTVLITGFRSEMDQAVTRALAQGADAVCFKPFDIPNLLTTLDQLAKTHEGAGDSPG